jgi:hypothetical protein
MITIDDLKNKELHGGYGTICDVSSLVSTVLAKPEDTDAWNEFWQELYHQSDIGNASLAVVPILVQELINKNYKGENLWAYVSSMEIVKGKRNNPNVPEWLLPSYSESINTLEAYSYQVASEIDNVVVLRYLFGFLLLRKGDFTYGQALSDLTPDVIEEALDNYASM